MMATNVNLKVGAAGDVKTMAFSKVLGGFEYVYPSDIKDNVTNQNRADEDWTGVRKVIKLRLEAGDTDVTLDLDYLINTYAQSKEKYFKIADGDSYDEVYIADDLNLLPNSLDELKYRNFELTLKSKSLNDSEGIFDSVL
jgi:hypothetical protein